MKQRPAHLSSGSSFLRDRHCGIRENVDPSPHDLSVGQHQRNLVEPLDPRVDRGIKSIAPLILWIRERREPTLEPNAIR